MLVQGTLDTGAWLLTGVLLVSSLLNVAYLLTIPVRGFFAAPAEPLDGIQEAPLPSLLAIGVTAAGCLALFLWADPLYRFAGEILR